jgi:K+-sensing histidine kinase KdpD
MLDTVEKFLWSQTEDSLDLQAGILCSATAEEGIVTYSVESAHSIPAAPFNGAQRGALTDVLNDCCKVGLEFHEHAVGNWALSNVVPRIDKKLHRVTVVVFTSVMIGENKYYFLGFPRNNARHKREASAKGAAKAIAEVVDTRKLHVKIQDRLKGTELYVKEVGHDFAVSIQAIISKLSYIELGNLNTEGIKAKAAEASLEVRNAYAIAEGLGVAMDPNYKIGNLKQVVLTKLLSEIAVDFETEARERNIVIRVDDTKGLKISCDRLPFKLAIANLVKNAIKYCNADTDVEVGGYLDNDRILIYVKNYGIGLPSGEECKKIWDFGFRTARARKLNINGSGIGLYSCKKITIAHGGQVWYDDHKNGATTFWVGVPIRSR